MKQTSKKKPSDILEEQLKKKELEFNFVKELFENKEQMNKILTKNNLEDLSILPKKKPDTKIKPTNPKDLLEKIEKNNKKREEKEKLKLLEKLESQVLKHKKKQLTSINKGTTSTQSEFVSHKRLIDNLNTLKVDTQNSFQSKDPSWKINKKILDDNDFRKTIKKEKIEIDCEKSTEIKKEIMNDAKLDEEYLNSVSKEKKKFFLFKVREVFEFLKSIHLVRLIETFIEDGIEDLECILDIDEDYFHERKFELEHQNKIMNKIKELKSSKGEGPKINSDIHSDNEYDEEEQARLFRQAVEEFRNRKVESSNELGTNPENDEVLLPANKERKCCWNCLKIILMETAFEHYFEEKIMKFKNFCSNECLKSYMDNIYCYCANENCRITIEKGSGKYFLDRWFCSENCIEKFMEMNPEMISEHENDQKGIIYSQNEDIELDSNEEKEIIDEEGTDIINKEYDPMLDF